MIDFAARCGSLKVKPTFAVREPPNGSSLASCRAGRESSINVHRPEFFDAKARQADSTSVPLYSN